VTILPAEVPLRVIRLVGLAAFLWMAACTVPQCDRAGQEENPVRVRSDVVDFFLCDGGRDQWAAGGGRFRAVPVDDAL